MTINIGLTGNMGSGKTTVCRIFESIGIPVYYSDCRAKSFLNHPSVKSKIIDCFGPTITDKSLNINKKILASMVFNNQDKLLFLNNLIHPMVISDYEAWKQKNSFFLYTIMESAILFESNLNHLFNKIIYVYCDADIRMQRIIQRDGLSKEDVEKRFFSQKPDENKISNSNIVIINNGKTALIPEVLRIDTLLRNQNDSGL